MAINTWLSRALAVAQVDTLTPGGTIEVGDIFNVTINGKTVAYSATGTTVASVVTGLVAALGAITDAEFTEITFTDSTTTVTCTGNTAGLPFTITVTTTESNGGAADAQTFVAATTTAATGPNHVSNINNWSLGAVPVDTNDVDIDLDRGSLLYGLDALAAVTLASIDVYSSGQTEGTIGLPQVNEAGGYYEYRGRYLQTGATLSRINTLSSRVMIDFGSVATTSEIRNAGSPTDDIPAVLLKGTSGSNVFEVKSGQVGFGFHLGEPVTIPMLRVATEGEAIIGETGTVTEIQSLGKVLLQNAATTVKVSDGETQIIGTGAVTTLTVDGGECKYESSGTVGTATVGPGRIDCAGDISPRTFSVTNIEPGGEIFDPRQTITHTAGIARSARVRQVSAA